MDLLGVFLDRSTRRLDHSRGDDHAWLRAEQCAALFSRLDQCGATGLHELTVKVMCPLCSQFLLFNTVLLLIMHSM